MPLSNLQNHILKAVYAHGGRCPRAVFENFYSRRSTRSVKIITRSIERLIRKQLLTGYGHKTADRWYTETVSLTAQGRKVARLLFGRQQTLPFRGSRARRRSRTEKPRPS